MVIVVSKKYLNIKLVLKKYLSIAEWSIFLKKVQLNKNYFFKKTKLLNFNLVCECGKVTLVAPVCWFSEVLFSP